MRPAPHCSARPQTRECQTRPGLGVRDRPRMFFRHDTIAIWSSLSACRRRDQTMAREGAEGPLHKKGPISPCTSAHGNVCRQSVAVDTACDKWTRCAHCGHRLHAADERFVFSCEAGGWGLGGGGGGLFVRTT